MNERSVGEAVCESGIPREEIWGDYMGAWKDMEKALKQGKVKTIGLKK